MASKHALLILLILIVFIFIAQIYKAVPTKKNLEHTATTSAQVNPSATPTATPTPTPRPLTFAEMNSFYGPCAYVSTLMYHHVQDLKTAEEQGHKNLTVAPELFRQQMEYLRNQGYTIITIQQLIAFFDQGVGLPGKSVLLTFDDGYDDFGDIAAPILREFGYTAILFIPTGLIENAGYLKWDTINGLSGQGFYMANHTWSHHNVAGTKEVIEKEISTADTQLANHGLNKAKVFAYPYGLSNAYAEQFLSSQGYTLAFTTQPGSILCKQQRFELPRIRIGNSNLGAYGL